MVESSDALSIGETEELKFVLHNVEYIIKILSIILCILYNKTDIFMSEIKIISSRLKFVLSRLGFALIIQLITIEQMLDVKYAQTNDIEGPN